MKSRHSVVSMVLATGLGMTMHLAAAANLAVSWSDAAGDPGPVGDVVSAKLVFDSVTGAWTASWWADPAYPFTGNARFNLNLFDTALGDPLTARAPQVSLDGFHDFTTSHASYFSYSGVTSYLSNWHVGDQVSTGNNLTFLSGAVNLNSPYGRDNIVALGTIAQEVPEPATGLMLLAGLGALGVYIYRRKSGDKLEHGSADGPRTMRRRLPSPLVGGGTGVLNAIFGPLRRWW